MTPLWFCLGRGSRLFVCCVFYRCWFNFVTLGSFMILSRDSLSHWLSNNVVVGKTCGCEYMKTRWMEYAYPLQVVRDSPCLGQVSLGVVVTNRQGKVRQAQLLVVRRKQWDEASLKVVEGGRELCPNVTAWQLGQGRGAQNNSTHLLFTPPPQVTFPPPPSTVPSHPTPTLQPSPHPLTTSPLLTNPTSFFFLGNTAALVVMSLPTTTNHLLQVCVIDRSINYRTKKNRQSVLKNKRVAATLTKHFRRFFSQFSFNHDSIFSPFYLSHFISRSKRTR